MKITPVEKRVQDTRLHLHEQCPCPVCQTRNGNVIEGCTIWETLLKDRTKILSDLVEEFEGNDLAIEIITSYFNQK